LKFKPVTKVTVQVVSFIGSHGLNHHQFQSFFLSEIDDEYWGRLVSYRYPMAELWGSVEMFLALRLETEMF
jgi:hypothetical protein